VAPNPAADITFYRYECTQRDIQTSCFMFIVQVTIAFTDFFAVHVSVTKSLLFFSGGVKTNTLFRPATIKLQQQMEMTTPRV